ncbi:MAG: enoyl-CoA hydratase/isomerase family protein [Candidatus Binatia bacterium]
MSWPAFHTLLIERHGAVTWLQLNRPARLNALTEESFEELGAALRAIGADADSRVLVLTGAGRGFCAGSDVEGLGERTSWSAPQQRERFDRLGRDVVLRLYGLAIPTVAAINGPASGGGLSLALACDIRIAAEDATITFGYTGMGLIPDLGATYFLPRITGVSRACYHLWRNSRLTASEALAIGLVDTIVPARELVEGATAVAAQIATAPQLAIRLGRAALRSTGHGTLEDALEAEAAAQSLCLQSADHRDRVRAFLRRRVPPAAAPHATSVE